MPDKEVESVKKRKHCFVGRIHKTLSDEVGFIRPNSIQRVDGGNRGLDVDDDVFVHINAFDMMVPLGHPKPEKLEEGMMIAFFIGPSGKKAGRVTAECCSVYELAE